MRVPEEVRLCVAYIGEWTPEDGPGGAGWIPRGTGFWVSKKSEFASPDMDLGHVYLVTAKHVAERLERNDSFVIRMNRKDGKAEMVNAPRGRWIHHETDQTADIAVFPWLPPQDVFDYRTVGTDIFLSDATIASASIGAGDEVFMTGLFVRVVGSERNQPIVRMGNVAMMPNEAVPTALGPIDAYLIEARSIGGLSGSPAFVRQTVGIGSGPFFLLGLVHGHWDIPPDAIQDVADHGGNGANVNMGIAIVVPAKKILEIIDQPVLVEGRRRFADEYRKRVAPSLDDALNKIDETSADN